MKIIKILSLTTAVLGLGVFGFTVEAQTTPANPNASQKAKDVLTYLYSLQYETSNRFLSGQNYVRAIYFDTDVKSIYDQTGYWVGMIGPDYVWWGATDAQNRDNIKNINAQIKNYWDSGGLTVISYHLSNPQTGGDAWDMNINWPDVLDPSTQTHNNFLHTLDFAVEGIRELRDAGVPVIFRPLHEMNGGWMWYGARPPEEFHKLWRFVYNYFTITHKLNNILWAYSPMYAGHDKMLSSLIRYYPGDDYVDLTAIDMYSFSPETDNYLRLSYEIMMGFGKPLFLAEYGPGWGPGLGDGPFPPWDYTKLMTAIKSSAPNMFGFLAYAGKWGLSRNSNAKDLLNDPWTINRDEINLTKAPCSDISYSTWHECRPNNKRTRTVVSQSPEGCMVVDPNLSEPCIYQMGCNEISAFGTYIEAEKFTGSIAGGPGKGTFSLETTKAGHLGNGYLKANGDGVGEGKEYAVNFTELGNYNVWLRAAGFDGSSDSLYIGLDNTQAGAIHSTQNGSWGWTNSPISGKSNVTVSTLGLHKLNIWIRENNQLFDGIYITKGWEYPTDLSHGITIDPTSCVDNPADVNSDNQVNIKDIQEVIRCIINSQSCNFPGRSNINGDGQVNIKDIQEIIKAIIK